MSSSHEVCFSLLLLKAIITFTTLGIPSNIRKSVVVNGDKIYTVYTFSYFVDYICVCNIVMPQQYIKGDKGRQFKPIKSRASKLCTDYERKLLSIEK